MMTVLFGGDMIQQSYGRRQAVQLDPPQFALYSLNEERPHSISG
jgi:hypothetical protein